MTVLCEINTNIGSQVDRDCIHGQIYKSIDMKSEIKKLMSSPDS